MYMLLYLRLGFVPVCCCACLDITRADVTFETEQVVWRRLQSACHVGDVA
jgi:hypothetical protein